MPTFGNRHFLWGLLAGLILGGIGCDEPAAVMPSEPVVTVAESDRSALLAEQRRAIGEAAGSMAVLADFEPRTDRPGSDQVDSFSLLPVADGSSRSYTDQMARTGSGALRVQLQPGTALLLHLSGSQDLSPFTLLTMAIHSQRLRDDLVVTLKSTAGEWASVRTIVRAGWNNVMIDIQRLADAEAFDVRAVQTVGFEFVDAGGPVDFLLDDVLLVENRRVISPTPQSIELSKVGLDYVIQLGGREGQVRIEQGNDGLWRLGMHQPTVKFAGPSEPFPSGGTNLDFLGGHRVGDVTILEHNALRLRIENTWFFPTRPGEWASQGVRHLRWVYTFYGDGRWVTAVQLNNAGGRVIGRVAFSLLGKQAAWADGTVAYRRVIERFVGPIGRWNYLLAASGPDESQLQQNYIDPPPVALTLGRAEVYVPGDADHDGFDESQGCYVLAGENGHCRFRLRPGTRSMLRPVFRILGPWTGRVSVNLEGLAIRDVQRLEDGSVVFLLPGRIDRPMAVEVFGPMESSDPDGATESNLGIFSSRSSSSRVKRTMKYRDGAESAGKGRPRTGQKF